MNQTNTLMVTIFTALGIVLVAAVVADVPSTYAQEQPSIKIKSAHIYPDNSIAFTVTIDSGQSVRVYCYLDHKPVVAQNPRLGIEPCGEQIDESSTIFTKPFKVSGSGEHMFTMQVWNANNVGTADFWHWKSTIPKPIGNPNPVCKEIAPHAVTCAHD